MATTHTLPGRQAPPAARPMSKVERSRLILAGTSAIVSTVLLIWLILSPMFRPPRRPYTILAGSLGAPDVLPGASSILAEDGRLLAERARSGARVEVGRREFEQALGDFVGRKGGDPVIIYLAAVGASMPADSEGTRAFLLTSDGPIGTKGARVSAAELLALLQEKKGPPRLLILDASPLGSDREAGVFGNGFLAQLSPLLRRDGNLAVLTSCAPGQVSWSSEADHRSVFSRYVAEGLSGKAARWGRVTVQGLHRYVSANVSRWAERHRDGAIQTPMLLGNDRLDFTLPRLDAPAEAVAADAKADAARDQLQEHWGERMQLAAKAPYRHAPASWRRYQDALLRAERMLRAGDPAGALKALSAARALKLQVEALADGPTLPRPHSLALLGPDDARAAAYRDAIERAIEGNAGDAAEPEPDQADSKAGPPPAKPEVEESQPVEEQPEAPPAKPPARPSKPPTGTAKPPKTFRKTAAGPADAPKPKAEAGKAAGPKPAKEAALPAPAEAADLSGGLAEGPPTFVEGQLALWYANFAASGGETEALKKSRLALLHRAVAVRARAEQAAAPDVRALPWARDLVDQADAARRQAQDQLFAGEAGAFKNCASRLARAETLYGRAIAVSSQCAKAIDLVQKLQDELPYYGDWQANRPEGLDDAFEELLSDAAELARLIDAGPGKEAEADEPRRKLAALAEKVEQAHTRLAADFRTAVDRASGKASTPSWREVDALLRVPSMPPEDRPTLRERAAVDATEAASEGEVADLAEPDKTDPDPGFWKRARALARLECGLLKLAGRDVRDLADWQEQAWSSRDKNAPLAFDAFDRFSARVRELRAITPRAGAPAPKANAPDESDPGDREEGESIDQGRRELLAADRAARALPAGSINDLAGDPARTFDDFQLHALLVWHARRLLEDFAPEHAERLLEEARQFASSKTLWEEFGRAHAMTEAALIVKGPSGGKLNLDASQDISVQVGGEGDLPAGSAALLLAHDPKVAINATVAGEGSLIPIPIAGSKPAARSIAVAMSGQHAGKARLVLLPEAFYRGRRFAAEGVELPDQENLVKVELRQVRTYKDVPDQFLLNPGKAFLHERFSLAYKLLITSRTGRTLDAYVTYTLDGLPSQTGHVTIAGRKFDDSLTGRIMPNDLPDDKPRLLTITVQEGDAEGRPLCKPVEIPCRKIHPREYITAADGLNGNLFQVWVVHEAGSDPVPLPAEVWVKVEPANYFREVGKSIKTIPHGRGRIFTFEMAPGLKEVNWSVGAEGVADIIQKKFVLEK